MITISRATQADVAALLPLVSGYWAFEGIAGFSPTRVGPPLERLLSAPTLGAGWMARADDMPLGYLLAVYVFSLEHLGLTAEIDEFFVLPEGRGRGVGEQLLRSAEAEFSRMACTNVSLQLARDNDAARRFYARHGFGDRDGYDLLDKSLPVETDRC